MKIGILLELKPPFRQLRSCRCEFYQRYKIWLLLFCLEGRAEDVRSPILKIAQSSREFPDMAPDFHHGFQCTIAMS